MPIRDMLARSLGLKASIIGLDAGELPDSGLDKAWDDASLLSTYGDDPWPYLCATKLAENAALAPLRFGLLDAEGEWEWVGADHPVQSLWDAPNPADDGAGLAQMVVLYLELVGHAPIEVVRPTTGARTIAPLNRGGFELYPVNPGPWRIVANADATVAGYLYVRGYGTDYRWTPDEMTYLRWPNPNDRWYGQGRLAAVRQEVMAEEYAGLRDKQFEKQLGVPPGILTSDLPLGEPTALELQRRWEKAVGGYRNAGRIAVLGSKTTYQAIAASARDAQWSEQRQRRQDTIAIAFGIPPVLMRMSDATFANAEQARAELWEGTLQPRLNRIAAMITRRLVPMLTSEPLVARFDYGEISALNENELEAVEIASKMANAAVATVGEVRSRIGLEPFGDERDDEVVMPTTLEWSGARAAAAAQSADLAARLADARTQQPVAQGEPQQPADEMPMAQPAKMRIVKARKRDRETLLAPVRSGFAADLRGYFSAQRGALRPIAKAQPADDDVVGRARDIIMALRWRARLERISRQPVETAQTIGATEAALELGVPASFLVDTSSEALDAVLRRTTNLPNLVNATTLADVEAAITSALAGGEGTAGINARLDELFAGYEEWRIDRIARTETAYAYAGGAVGQMREAGISQVVISDGDGDDACAAADGATWTIDAYEADPLGHPNCTRDYTPLFETVTASAEPPSQTTDVLVEVVKALAARPPVTIHADGVTFEMPEQPAPVVNVTAPAPVVVPAPAVVVNIPEPKARTHALLRDKTGVLVGLQETIDGE